MSKPKIVDKKAIAINVEQGKRYQWCACGRSTTQPFCDGSHRGSAFLPREFTAEKTGVVYLCLCKYSENPPFCDGSHALLDDQSDD